MAALPRSATSIAVRVFLAATFLFAAGASERAAGHATADERIARLSETIARQPCDIELLLARAATFRSHREWDAALDDLDRAASCEPELARIGRERGRTWLAAGRFEQARIALAKYVAAAPGEPDGHLAYARALSGLGRIDDAVREYSRAIELEPAPDPDLYLDRARLLARAGNLAGALAGIEAGLDRLGEPSSLHLHAVELEVAMGNFDAALARVERAAARAPHSVRWKVRRAQILERGGRGALARAAYRQALADLHHLPVSRQRAAMTGDMEVEIFRALERLRSAPGAEGDPQ